VRYGVRYRILRLNALRVDGHQLVWYLLGIPHASVGTLGDAVGEALWARRGHLRNGIDRAHERHVWVSEPHFAIGADGKVPGTPGLAGVGKGELLNTYGQVGELVAWVRSRRTAWRCHPHVNRSGGSTRRGYHLTIGILTRGDGAWIGGTEIDFSSAEKVR